MVFRTEFKETVKRLESEIWDLHKRHWDLYVKLHSLASALGVQEQTIPEQKKWVKS